MCFYDGDYDWTAQVCTEEVGPAAVPTHCDECHRTIPQGERVRHIYQQEREVCRHNPMSDYYQGEDTDSEECPEGCQHDYGETFEYDCCEACDQLIEGIHQHELDEGCAESESRPSLGELYDAMHEGDGAAYLAKAEELYPGIAGRLPRTFLPREREEG